MRRMPRLVRTVTVVTVSAALGAGASLGVSACGEEREGDVEIEQGTTGGATTGGETTGGETESETGTAP
jgi:hypothetical protein